jgi:hypothetical protein
MQPVVQLAVLVLAACGVSAQAARQTWTVTRRPDAAFSAVSAVLAESGYVILDADRDAGFLRASRQKSSALESALTGIDEEWQISATIVASDSGTTIILQPAYLQHRPYGRMYHGTISSEQQDHVTALRMAILVRLVPRR